MNSLSTKKTTISIIVPVYNVEAYIRQCIDSILAQTYRDIEVILIDDGSPDQCGKICDEYAAEDGRVRVFHTENSGLSAARNLGIKKARGEYIGFVDSDDWVEPDMYEILLKEIEGKNADICVCGCFIEFADTRKASTQDEMVMTADEAVRSVLLGKLSTMAMDKLIHSSLFSDISFPEGHVFEDVPTFHKIFNNAKRTVRIPKALYHYRQRNGSIIYSHTMPNMMDDWLAHKERYQYYKNTDKYKEDREVINQLLYYCAESISKTWKDAYGTGEWKQYSVQLKEMSEFARNSLPLFGKKEWPSSIRLCTFMSRNVSGFSLFITFCAARFIRVIRRRARLYP